MHNFYTEQWFLVEWQIKVEDRITAIVFNSANTDQYYGWYTQVCIKLRLFNSVSSYKNDFPFDSIYVSCK